MLKLRTIFFLGIWVSILPFLGFPIFWKNILFVFSGMLLLIVSYLLYKEKTRNSPEVSSPYQSFSEARPDKDVMKDVRSNMDYENNFKQETFSNNSQIVNEIKENDIPKERKKIYRPSRIHASRDSHSSFNNSNQESITTHHES